MEKTEIIEGNKLIAEFMGALNHKEKGPFKYSVHDQQWAEEGLQYDWNWNWLMDVIEKIENFGNYFPIEKNGALVSTPYPKEEEKPGLYCITEYVSAPTKIEASWKTAIQFIKWHNKKESKS